MDRLIRKQLYITRGQDSRLKQKAEQMGITQAELVRGALDSHSYTVNYSKRNIDIWLEEVEFIKTEVCQKEGSTEKRTWKRKDLYDR